MQSEQPSHFATFWKDDIMCKKVNFSIPEVVDSFLTETKKTTGMPKSQILSLLVMKHGDELAKNLSKYSKKGETVQSVSAYVEQ